MNGQQRDDLVVFARWIATGPLDLHHAIKNGIAAYDAGTALDLKSATVLREHTGGWFALSGHIDALLAAIENAAIEQQK